MLSTVDVAIVGAGPYGLSLAAHLRQAGISFRIFGKPMATWRGHMPKGMCLKSEGFASNLSAPDKASTLEAWCAANGKDYSAQKTPVALDDFVAYADWFTRTYVPTLEQKIVAGIVRDADGYTLTLEDGARLKARRVVMAVGITWFKNLPEALRALPKTAVSHSFDHHDLGQFKGRDVTVLGAGASAIDTAIALHEAGAGEDRGAAQGDPPSTSRRTMTSRRCCSSCAIPTPASGRAGAPSSAPTRRCCSTSCREAAPGHHAPPSGARAGWFTREKVEGKIPAYLGQHLQRALRWPTAASRWS